MTQKTACLTIDDAPSPVMNEKMDYLLRKKIPAVWFCQGNFLEQRPDFALRAIREGFIVGNHSYDHPNFSDLPLDECREQIRRTDETIEALYETVGVERSMRCFRFPYGDKGGLQHSNVLEPYSEAGLERKQAIQSYLRQLGYRQPRWEQVTYRYYRANGLQEDVDWYWTYDVMEWSIFADEPFLGIDSPEKMFARMDEDVPEGGRGLNSGTSAEVVLTHDHVETAAYFEPIIERLLEKGLTFVRPGW